MIPVMDSGQQKTSSDIPRLAQADLEQCLNWLPVRDQDSHKGSNGRVLIEGGEQSMAGAVCLAGWSAYIAGAGLVRVATTPGNVTAITSCRPELLVSGISVAHQLKELFQQVDVIALGPGLGQTKWSNQIFEFCLEHGEPGIIDADGLNLLAQSPEKRQDWILSPHPGEAARLLHCDVHDIQADRIAAAREIVSLYGGLCVLKGRESLIISDDESWICPYGNAALAVAGTGDVLTGLMAGLLAQGMNRHQAAVASVVLHAKAAEYYTADNGGIGMLASDLMLPLRQLRNGHKS
jgi:hydroxyethylthiazole kinase-like uncharacterized protein yjeF